MKLEVFFCTCPQTAEREQAAVQALDWLDHHSSAITIVTPDRVGCSLKNFNRQRRVWAEEKAKGKFYVLTDDDLIPDRADALAAGCEALLSHPDFAILSAWPSNANIGRWTPFGYDVYEDLDVTEHVSVGGLRFVRRGAMPYWPTTQCVGYDRVQADALRNMKWRVGYCQHVRALHLGEGKSELWR